MIDLQNIRKSVNHQESFQFFAPGRINIIGEHIDYNGGFVMPAAISLGVTMTISPRNDKKVSLSSEGHSHICSLDLDKEIRFAPEDTWANYPKGIIDYLCRNKFATVEIKNGWDIHYQSTLPMGAGLSSSAAIEVVTAYGIMNLLNVDADPKAIAFLAQKVENEFIGVKCGLMDQFAVAMGMEKRAILLNTSNNDFRYVLADMPQHVFVVMNTNKPRALAESKYNERKEESEAALALLKANVRPNKKEEYKEKNHLCDYSVEDVNFAISNPILKKRAMHAVTEQKRVLSAEKALVNKDIKELGRLMLASHIYLRDFYEVSCHELNIMVSLATKQASCVGARMVGAGFGGCALAVVQKTNLDSFLETMHQEYYEQTNILPDFYVCGITNGVTKL